MGMFCGSHSPLAPGRWVALTDVDAQSVAQRINKFGILRSAPDEVLNRALTSRSSQPAKEFYFLQFVVNWGPWILGITCSLLVSSTPPNPEHSSRLDKRKGQRTNSPQS